MGMLLALMVLIFMTSFRTSLATSGDCNKHGVVIPVYQMRAITLDGTTCEAYYCHGYSYAELQVTVVCASGCVDVGSTVYCQCLSDCPSNADDPCEDAPCQNGGKCSPVAGGGYECTCTSDYQGDQCQTEVDWCEVRDCQNNGTCILDSAVAAKARCQCTLRYKGDQCEQEVCDPNPCRNEGQCSAIATSPFYQCNCTDGYTGYTCLLCEDTNPADSTNATCQELFEDGDCQNESKQEIVMSTCSKTCGFCVPPQCRDGWSMFNLSCYTPKDMRQVYTEAERLCRSYNGEVSVPRSQEENTYIRSLLSESMWVGAVYNTDRGAWITGSNTVAFENFNHWDSNGEPDPAEYHCVKMRKNGKWTGHDCTRKKVFVCYYDL